MLDELLLLSGNDIPFPIARLTIHQPSLKEIAYITEQRFWPGCELLKFNKQILLEEDKINLFNQSNFNIIMSMVRGKNIQSYQARLNILSVFALLFPKYQILLVEEIKLKHSQNGEISIINDENFQAFKEILVEMFCLSDKENKQYNPSGQLAKKIADQIKRGREKKAKLAPEGSQKIAILSRFASILAVGEKKDMNDLMNYTVYQLMDEFNRFELKMQYDSWFKLKIAGAKDLSDPEDWLKDIHEK